MERASETRVVRNERIRKGGVQGLVPPGAIETK